MGVMGWIIYLVGFFICAVILTRVFAAFFKKDFGKYYEQSDAVLAALFGTLASLVWPVAVIIGVVYLLYRVTLRYTFRRPKSPVHLRAVRKDEDVA
jgi:hypothetical protein